MPSILCGPVSPKTNESWTQTQEEDLSIAGCVYEQKINLLPPIKFWDFI